MTLSSSSGTFDPFPSFVDCCNYCLPVIVGCKTGVEQYLSRYDIMMHASTRMCTTAVLLSVWYHTAV